MINTPEFAFANARDYLRLDRVLARDPMGADAGPYFALAKLGLLKKNGIEVDEQKRLQHFIENDPLLNSLSEDDKKGTFASLRVAGEISRQTVRNPLQVQYFGAAPFLFGAGQAMKFSAVPSTATKQEPFDPNTITADDPSENYLSAALNQTMECGEDICYDFKIQTRSIGAEGLNIEDATTTWPDEETEYVGVARITIKVPQEPHSDDELEHCENLAFSPWHALAAHQPLGGINRLRRKVYSDSARHRKADGHCT